MKQRIIYCLLGFLPFLALAQPSFECSGNLTKQEELICATENHQLQSLDRNLADLYYASLVIEKDVVRKNQKKWISSRNKCKDVICLTDSYYSQLKSLSDYLWENRNKIPACSNNRNIIAYKGMLSSLEKKNWRNLQKYYLSEIMYEKASRQGDGSVDLDRDGVIDVIAGVLVLEERKQRQIHYNKGIITKLDNCLINIQTIGSFSSPYSGSYGNQSMDSFPLSSLPNSIKIYSDPSNDLAINEIKRILSKDNFDMKNLSILRTYYHTGCAGGSLTDSLLAYDINLQDYRTIYSRKLACGKQKEQTFYYPIEN